MDELHQRIAQIAQALSDAGWGMVVIVPWQPTVYRITAKRWSGKAGDVVACVYSLPGGIIRDIAQFQDLVDSLVTKFEDLWDVSGYA